jgi:hypothetical protein
MTCLSLCACMYAYVHNFVCFCILCMTRHGSVCGHVMSFVYVGIYVYTYMYIHMNKDAFNYIFVLRQILWNIEGGTNFVEYGGVMKAWYNDQLPNQ